MFDSMFRSVALVLGVILLAIGVLSVAGQAQVAGFIPTSALHIVAGLFALWATQVTPRTA